jgi:hypothetical protein
MSNCDKNFQEIQRLEAERRRIQEELDRARGVSSEDLKPERAFLFRGKDGKDYEANFWYSVFVPARTPKPIIDKLNEAIRTTLANPAMQKKFVEQGLDPQSSTPKELGDLMAKDSKRLGEVVRKAAITAE